jgi:hypothetical protein
MAKYRGEKKSGKMGDVIYSSWHGRPYVRRRPEKVANPQTADQQNHRSAFGEISRLSSAMKEGHAKGLHWHAVRQKKNTYCVFKSINKDCYGPDGIVYPHIRISSGTVPDVQITSAEIDEQGMVRVSFDGGRTLGHDKDEFYLFVFCPDLREGHFAHPVERTVGLVDAQIPEQWLGHTLHLYAFMRDAKDRTSETIYVVCL